MSFIASIVLADRIVQVSDSRVVTGWGEEMQVQIDDAKKLFTLPGGYSLAWAGVHFDPATGRTVEEALERFNCPELPPPVFADSLRDHLAAYWEGADEPQFCFHLVGYYRGRPFLLTRFNPPPPPELAGGLNAPILPFELRFNGADDDSVIAALKGVKFPPFRKIPPVQMVNFLVDMVNTVIDQVPCCGGDVQVHVITPGGITDFKAVRKPRVWRAAYAPGKYGMKVTQGEIYSTSFQTGAPGEATYITLTPGGTLESYYNGKQNLGMWAGQNWGNMIFYEDGVMAGQLYAESTYDPLFDYQVKRMFFVWARGDGSLCLTGPGLDLRSDKIKIGDDLTSQIIINGKIDGNLMPYDPLFSNIGEPSVRWHTGYFDLLRATDLAQGDICFEETICPLCEKSFAPGDTIVLLVRHIDEGFLGTMCVPIHSGCQGISKTLTREIQDTEIKYVLKEDGNIETCRVPKYEEVEEQIYRLKKDFEFDENTGQFKKKALVVPVSKEGYSARLTKRGLKFYDDRTGLEVELSAIQEPVEVFPERPATKEEALELVTVKRRRPVYRTVTVKIGDKE